MSLRESEWHDLRHLVYDSAGIKLSETKRVFLVSRLLKRLKATGVATFREYFRHVTRAGKQSEEHQQLVNAVTTNKTDFFREREHFNVLGRWLNDTSPRICRAKANGLKIWCAAASTGEEPYTIAAVLREHLTKAEWTRATVFASDIDTNVLATAQRAVYDAATVDAVDALWRMKMFVQGSGTHRHNYRVQRDLREHVTLFQCNLVQPDWPMDDTFDAVFCRNVLIYFDRPTQARVTKRLLERVAHYGLLFLGHAESLNGLSVSALPIAHSVYGRKGSYESVQLKAAQRVAALQVKATAREGSGAQSRLQSVPLGRTVMDATQAVKVRVERGAMLLIYDTARSRNAVTHLDVTSADRFVTRVIQEASRLSARLRDSRTDRGRLASKLVTCRLESIGTLATVDVLAPYFAEHGIELLAVRHLEISSMLLVDPNTGRVQIRPTKSSTLPNTTVVTTQSHER